VVGQEEGGGIGLQQHVPVDEVHAYRNRLAVLAQPRQELLAHVERRRLVARAELDARQAESVLA
jgi:hypothetical protein